MNNVKHIEQEVRYTMVDEQEQEHVYTLVSGCEQDEKSVVTLLSENGGSIELPLSEVPFLIPALQLFAKTHVVNR